MEIHKFQLQVGSARASHFLDAETCEFCASSIVVHGTLKCYYRPTASLQLNNKRNTKYNITVT